MGVRTWLPISLTAVFAACVAVAIWLALTPASSLAGASAKASDPASGAQARAASGDGDRTSGDAGAQPLHTPLVAPADRVFPDEGVWHTLAVAGDGDPLVQGTLLHTDRAPAAVVWIRQSAARFELHPGYNQPGGGAWSVPDVLARGHREGLVATWNGGFLMHDSGGGFYLDGKQTGALVPGVASEIFHRDGSMTVGLWGRDAPMTPDVVGVRQQRGLLVDAGRLAPDIDALGDWGATDSGATYVRRSGVGVTAQGDVVYVIGRAMSPRSLATALQQAGAVRAMQLDINISWPSFMAYDGRHDPADPRPYKFGDFPRAAERYYQPSARDFVAVYARSAGGGSAGTCADTAGGDRGEPGGSGSQAVAC